MRSKLRSRSSRAGFRFDLEAAGCCGSSPVVPSSGESPLSVILMMLRTRADSLKLSRAEQIPIFVADPPFLRHEHGNSAILDGNLQMSLKNGGCRQAAKIDKTRLASVP